MVDNDISKEPPAFDFIAHEKSAKSEYTDIYPSCEKFTKDSKDIISDILNTKKIKYHSIEARAKGIEEFCKKAAKQSKEDPTKPKYPDPLKNITDMAGVRVITFLPRVVEEVCKLIEQEFLVTEKIDKTEESMKEGRIGYQSIHYIVKLKTSRTCLPKYASYKDLVLEIQVRTILQHAWAEMEHDIQYKTDEIIPQLIKRRFIALAGLLDIADREFQTLHEECEEKNTQRDDKIEKFISNLNKSLDIELRRDFLKELSLWIDSDKIETELNKYLDSDNKADGK